MFGQSWSDVDSWTFYLVQSSAFTDKQLERLKNLAKVKEMDGISGTLRVPQLRRVPLEHKATTTLNI